MKTPRGALVVRADASFSKGTGHVIRCLALAQSWQDVGGAVTFVMAQAVPGIEQLLSDEKVGLVLSPEPPGSERDARHLLRIAENLDAGWIVVDGYHFEEDYQWLIKRGRPKLMWVDDAATTGHFSADVILNQNVTASPEMYFHREPHTILLLGNEYVMLRRDFRRWQEWRRDVPVRAKRILVTLGGSDPDCLTLPVMTALANIHEVDLEIRVVVGAGNPKLRDLQGLVKNAAPRIQLFSDVRNMAEQMAESDIAVICGGGTLWESLYMMCATFSYSRPGVQDQINEKVHGSGAILNLGRAEDFDGTRLSTEVMDMLRSPEKRRLMAQRGREVVDGLGTSRIIRALDGVRPGAEAHGRDWR